MSAPSFATSWQRLHQSHRWTTSAHIPKPYLWRKWKRGGSVVFYDILIFPAESLWRLPRVHNFTYLQRDFNNAGGLVTTAWWSQLHISPIKLCFAIYFRVHMSSSKLCLVLLFSFLREKARTRLGGAHHCLVFILPASAQTKALSDSHRATPPHRETEVLFLTPLTRYFQGLVMNYTKTLNWDVVVSWIRRVTLPRDLDVRRHLNRYSRNATIVFFAQVP